MGAGVPFQAGTAVCIVAAMESELRHALAALDSAEPSTFGPWNVWYGWIDDVPTLLLLCGVGMVNAASALTAILPAAQPRAVINFGCAGAHSPDLAPGAVVLGSSVVASAARTILPDGSERYGGFLFDMNGERVRLESIEADPRLLAAATAVSESIEWQAQPNGGVPRVSVGTIASGDTWTQHPARIEQLREELGSLCEEMEAAALAQVCAIYQTPFLAVKDISNNELIVATPMGDQWPTLDDVVEHLGETAFAVVRAMLPRLAGAVS
ncbi:MAG TPA: 5'-methylthioadenosine/S-adenosylhomocysteine nucleosidase [Thermomicrobiaceae bacterium]|nr:5'-methylthioadenosine/S-adenosylhomocysteine nucleosidase [Thermomicrobiaceae bacterium]